MNNYESELKKAGDGFISFLKWIAIAAVVGVIVGLVGVFFHLSVEKATELRTEFPWLIWLLPFGGVAIVLLYKKAGMEHDRGTNLVLDAVSSNEPLSIKTAPLIFISTVITHLFEGSSGREGAALQMGGSIASYLGKHINLDEDDQRIITMCGMSAGFSALFGTPVAAAVFALEVVSVGVMYHSAGVPCIVAAAVGAYVAKLFGIAPTAFTLVGEIPQIGLVMLIKVAVLGGLCALISMLFCLVLEKAHHAYDKIPNRMAAVFIGGLLVIALTYIVGTRDYNGAGMDVINRAVAGEASPAAFLLKIIFTAVTLGAGFKGGEIVPTLFVGATFGNIAGKILGIGSPFGSGLGMIALFCGVTNCPITSLILSIELFGMDGLIYYAVACAVSYRLSGYYGLYSSQRIVYSKVRPEFINKNTL
ncbi:MAG: chloride channel protein [Clostridiales bacterium]|nr:chloride channel protein [Clostridiales bacterium]